MLPHCDRWGSWCDYVYIEPGVPLEDFDLSGTQRVVAAVARSGTDEWQNLIPYDRGPT